MGARRPACLTRHLGRKLSQDESTRRRRAVTHPRKPDPACRSGGPRRASACPAGRRCRGARDRACRGSRCIRGSGRGCKGIPRGQDRRQPRHGVGLDGRRRQPARGGSRRQDPRRRRQRSRCHGCRPGRSRAGRTAVLRPRRAVPSSSGTMQRRGEVTTLDGRETAPLDATPTLFQNEDGEPLKFWDAVVGGLSVGTPGTPALHGGSPRPLGHARLGAPLR